MRTLLASIIFILFFSSCKKDAVPDPGPSASSMYFPPLTGTTWESSTPSSLGWNTTALDSLYAYLQSKGTRGFIILKNGKMVSEKYFGTFHSESLWYWASAGKTLTSFIVGIAQQEGKLNINHKSSQYLGAGWTSLPLAKEDEITIRHQLTMTSGLDDGVPNNDCTTPACLVYKADAGTRWSYHNAPYTLLESVVEAATGQTYNAYTTQKVKEPIGMNGSWVQSGDNNVYYSNTRSAARFGLLLLNKGKWNGTTVLADESYINAMTASSQTINPSYGYLTWLNGKSSYKLPQSQVSFSGMLVPNAPADLYAALGKNDQKIYVVPSQKLVVVRFGDPAGNPQLALSSFDNEIWSWLKLAIGY